jgi:VCBS repeat-containing protein
MFFFGHRRSRHAERRARPGLEALETRALLSGNPPTANPDFDSTNEDTAKDVNVLANDTDPENDVLSVSAFDATSAKGATISLNADGTLKYDPTTSAMLNALAVGEMTTDTFTYAVTDGTSTSMPTTVTITVTGLNDPPTAVNDTAGTDEDTAININVLANDTDPDTSDMLTVSAFDATSAKGATLTRNADGTLKYDPTTSATLNGLAAGDTTTDTFSYTASDGNGGTSTATVTITVTGVNDPPVFTSATTASVPENTTAVLTVTATDPENQTVTFSVSGGADGGLFNIDPTTGALTFKTAPDFEAPADSNHDNQYEVVVAASDGIQTSTQTIDVTVTNVNEAPVNTVPTADQQVFRNGTLLFRTAGGNALSVADQDAGTGVLSVGLHVTSGRVKLGTTSGLATVTGNNTGTVTLTGTLTAINAALQNTSFTAATGFTGAVTLTMTTNDQGNTGPGGAMQDVDTVTIHVANRPPTVLANSGYHAMLVSRPAQLRRLNVPASVGLLSRVVDADGDPLRIQVLSAPRTAHGTPAGSLVVGPNGAFSYTPPVGFYGRVTFTYRVSDGLAFTAPITMIIDVLLPVAPWQRRALP